jgi:hypothetical protein
VACWLTFILAELRAQLVGHKFRISLSLQSSYILKTLLAGLRPNGRKQLPP